MKHLHCTYESVMIMPTYERKMFIDFLKRENNMRDEQVENVRTQAQSTGKGKRTKTISGDAVKAYSGKV